MKPTIISSDAESSETVSARFEKAPVLVEVRFPGMGTSPDWYLCEDEREFRAIRERLAPSVELHLRSVWDLKPSANEVTIRT